MASSAGDSTREKVVHETTPCRRRFSTARKLSCVCNPTKFVVRTNLLPRRWLVFDVAFSPTGRAQDAQFLRYTQLLQHCNAVALPALRPLFTGSINKCMNYDPVFATTVPALFQLPPLADNNAEGVVVRCDVAAKGQTLFEATLRDAKDRVVRAVAKRKAPQFAEVLAR